MASTEGGASEIHEGIFRLLAGNFQRPDGGTWHLVWRRLVSARAESGGIPGDYRTLASYTLLFFTKP